MNWPDTLMLAARELRRRPARCALTITSVLLAAALLVALLAVVTTARTRVLTQISKGGALAAISIEPASPNPGEAALDNPTPGPPRAITTSAVDQFRALPDVASVEPVTAAPVTVLPLTPPPAGSTLCAGATATSGSSCSSTDVPGYPSRVVSADLGDISALPITLLAGNAATAGTAEVDVGVGYLQHLGLPQSKASELLGTYLEVGSERFVGPYVTGATIEAYQWETEEIVGVVDQQVGTGDIVSWPALANDEWGWQSGDVSSAPYLAVVVVANQLSEVPAVRQQITAIGYSTSASEGLIVSVGRYIHVVEIVLSGIGVVALIIAALGIANALFASVRERRYEIGVMKAIGARDRDVLRIFLAEAIAIGIGEQASNYLTSEGLTGVTIAVPWVLLLGGAVGSALISFAAGLPAALRAAHLPAREAVAR
ncbi:MAG: FtsX-like permease family protein [Acidimicrobiales bacterium]